MKSKNFFQRTFNSIKHILLIAILVLVVYITYLLYVETPLGPWAIVILFYFFSLLFSLQITFSNRPIHSKLAWVLFINIVPIVGHITFLFWGQEFKKKIKYKDHIKKSSVVHENHNQDSILSPPESAKILFKKVQDVVRRPFYNASFDVFNFGGESYKNFFHDLESAEKFIHLHLFIVKPGEIYEHFKDILIRKAKSGVKVRIIIDDFGTWLLSRHEFQYLRNNKIEVFVFGKIQYPIMTSSNNYRSHRKLAIIDGQIAHFGGINIADEYADLNKKFGRWIDFQSRVEGELVRSFSLLFIDDWKKLTNISLDIKEHLLEEKISKNKSAGILIEGNPEFEESIIHKVLLSAIYNAKKSIIISTPYFIPSNEMLIALKWAALSGVEIKVYFPGFPDKISGYIIAKNWIAILSSYNVKFRICKDMFLHTKVFLFDNEYSLMGTANLDSRSLYIQYEVATLAYGNVINQILELFDYYEKITDEIDKNFFPKTKFGARFIKLLSILMSPNA